MLSTRHRGASLGTRPLPQRGGSGRATRPQSRDLLASRSASTTPVSGTVALWGIGGTHESGSTSFTVGPTWTQISAPLDVTQTGHTTLRAQVHESTTGTAPPTTSTGRPYGDMVSSTCTPAPSSTILGREDFQTEELEKDPRRSPESSGERERLFCFTYRYSRHRRTHFGIPGRIARDSLRPRLWLVVRCPRPCTQRECSWGGGRGSCGPGHTASSSADQRAGRRSGRRAGRPRRRAWS